MCDGRDTARNEVKGIETGANLAAVDKVDIYGAATTEVQACVVVLFTAVGGFRSSEIFLGSNEAVALLSLV